MSCSWVWGSGKPGSCTWLKVRKVKIEKRNTLLYFQVMLNQFDISWFWQSLTRAQTFLPVSLMGSIVSGGVTGRAAHRISIQYERLRVYIVKSRKPAVRSRPEQQWPISQERRLNEYQWRPFVVTSWFQGRWTSCFVYIIASILASDWDTLEDRESFFWMNTGKWQHMG